MDCIFISDSDASEFSHIDELLSNSLSFLYLNVQSLLPKLDMILAEYSEFDILSFTETWLNSLTGMILQNL